MIILTTSHQLHSSIYLGAPIIFLVILDPPLPNLCAPEERQVDVEGPAVALLRVERARRHPGADGRAPVELGVLRAVNAVVDQLVNVGGAHDAAVPLGGNQRIILSRRHDAFLRLRARGRPAGEARGTPRLGGSALSGIKWLPPSGVPAKPMLRRSLLLLRPASWLVEKKKTKKRCMFPRFHNALYLIWKPLRTPKLRN